MACEIIQEVCKRPGERCAFPPFEFVDLFARRWIANQPFAAGVRIRPFERNPTGLEYESSGGVTGGREPKRWPSTLGGTVVDGSITWTARAMSYDSLVYRIEDVEYVVDAGITLHERPFVDQPGTQQVPVEISGGQANNVYDVLCRVRTVATGQSQPLREAILRVTIEQS